MFVVIAPCFAYFEECEKCFQLAYANGASLVLLGTSMSVHKPKPPDTQPGPQSRAQLPVQAQSLSLRGLACQGCSYNQKHLQTNPVWSSFFCHKLPADVILKAHMKKIYFVAIKCSNWV